MANRTASKNNAQRTSPVAEQEGIDTDWVEATSTTLSTQPTELNVDGTSTSTSLVSSSTLTQGQEVTLVKSDNTYVDGELGVVTGGTESDGTLNTSTTDIVPSMTGFTTPSGVAFSTLEEFGTLASWEAFDDDGANTTGWEVTASGLPETIGYAPSTGAFICNKFTITSEDNGLANARGPASFDLVGTNSVVTDTASAVSASWTVIASYTGQTWTQNQTKTFTATNGTSYLAYGIKVNTNNGDTYMGIKEIEFIEAITEYTADITSFSLGEVPTKAFLKDDTSISLAIESTPERIVNELDTHLTVEGTTDNTNLVVTEPVYEGEKLFIDDTEVTLGTVTGAGPYSVAHGLGTTPTTAFRKGNLPLTVIGTPTTTEIVGTHATSGLLTTGDTVLIDNNKPVVASNVVEGTHDAAGGLVDSIDPFGDGNLVYKLEMEDATATVGTSPTNTGVTFQAGLYGDAGLFAETGKYLALPTNFLDAVATSGKMFFNVDVYPTSHANFNTIVGQQYISNDSRGFHIRLDQTTGYITALFYSNGTNAIFTVTGTTTVTLNQWSNIQLEWDGTTTAGAVKIYLNDTLEASGTSTLALATALANKPLTGSMYLGRVSNADTQGFDGLIDQVELYDDIRTAEQRTILNTQTASIPKYTCTIPTQGSAPTQVAVPSRTQKLTVSSKLFDGTKFNYTYGNYVKQGRAMATKLESSTSGTTVLSPITTNLNKA